MSSRNYRQRYNAQRRADRAEAKRVKLGIPEPVQFREFSSGKMAQDSADGKTRWLLRDSDGTVYAKRCLGCGNADKIYQNSHHDGNCPFAYPETENSAEYFVVRDSEEDYTVLSGPWTIWKDADNDGLRFDEDPNIFVMSKSSKP